MTDEEVLDLGYALEDEGLSHSEIDAYLEHFGVRGMKWGVRKKRDEASRREQFSRYRSDRRAKKERDRALNAETRRRDRETGRANARTHAQRVDEARRRVNSGDARADYREARRQYRQDRQRVGSREARNILARHREDLYREMELAEQPRDVGEVITRIFERAANPNPSF